MIKVIRHRHGEKVEMKMLVSLEWTRCQIKLEMLPIRRNKTNG